MPVSHPHAGTPASASISPASPHFIANTIISHGEFGTEFSPPLQEPLSVQFPCTGLFVEVYPLAPEGWGRAVGIAACLQGVRDTIIFLEQRR